MKPEVEWLDETGGIPDVSGWLDETGTIPMEDLSEEIFGPPADDSEYEYEEEEFNTLSFWEEQEEPGAQEALSFPAWEEDWEDEWSQNTESLPRLRPGEWPDGDEELHRWDDRLDEEPDDWDLDEEGNWEEEVKEEAFREEEEFSWPFADKEEEFPGNLNDEDSFSGEPGAQKSEDFGEYIEADEFDEVSEDASPWQVFGEFLHRCENSRGLGTAALVLGLLIAALVCSLAVTAAGNKRITAAKKAFSQVGEELEGENPIGADSIEQIALAVMEREQEEQEALEEQEEQEARDLEEALSAEGSVEVEFVLSSIQSDLKIKFRRKVEQSLIGGVPFAVTLATPAGGSVTYTDTDEDGVIYLTDLISGTYTVTMQQLLDLETLRQEEEYYKSESYVKYAQYDIPSESQSIDVTDQIAYEVVDVSDEVMSADEIDVSVEDTAINDTPVESVIVDTVEYVESTKTLITDSEYTYEEVSKSEVPNPFQVAYADLLHASFRKLSEVQEETSDEEEETDSGQEEDDSEEEEDDSEETVSEGSDSEGSDSEETDSEESDSEGSDSEETDTEEEEEELQLSVSPSQIRLTVGNTQTISAQVTGTDTASIIYTSSDEEIATVSDGGTVKAIAQGSCEIRVELSSDADIYDTVSVTVSSLVDEDSLLEDGSGNQLYVRDGDSYREAVAADYDDYDTFYRRTLSAAEYRYTGWQTINGLTYYYNADGEYVTGSQIIQGISYYFSEEGILDTGSLNTGIDISFWNGSINWSKVAESGITFAIVRCGYRGSTEGMLVKDSMVESNAAGAKNAGLSVGLYFFSQAVNEAEAVEEASLAVQIANSLGISMPIFVDVESSGGRGDSVSVSQRTANILAFCRTVESAGYSAGVYANTNWFTEKIDTSQLTSYHIWLAQYAAEVTYTTTRYDIWQYTSSGIVNGIDGSVDLNISYRDY